MPLHIDYRPDNFDDFVGSENTIHALKAKLKSKDLPHAYLFTGPSGCGKTTLARILARILGATDSYNYSEVDSASYTGIDDVRSIRSKMRMAPTGKAKARVWLLDECHRMSSQALDGFLKALEDTPSHVYFIFATTELQSLLKKCSAIKRRFAHYVLEPVSNEEMREQLNWVVECEEKEVTEDTITYIIEQAEGSIGKALSILDTIIDLPLDKMEEAAEEKAEELKAAIDLCRGLISRPKWSNVSSILKDMKKAKEDPERIRRAVLGYCTAILLKGKNDQAYLVMDCFKKPFYDSPFEQLVLACYEVVEGE
jgi:DNA polymerase-3 subunit gamma/tau